MSTRSLRVNRSTASRLASDAMNRLRPVLKGLQHPTVEAVHASQERLDVLELPTREGGGVEEHRPVRAREVVRQKVHALTRQIAGELVHGRELRLNVRPKFLFAFGKVAASFPIDGRIARAGERVERFPCERRAQ